MKTFNPLSRKHAGQPRPRVKPWWRTRRGLAALGLAILAATGGGVWSLWESGTVGRWAGEVKWSFIQAAAEAGLTVEDVLVAGRRETARADLLKAVGVSRGMPILAFDPAAAKARIEALPWVRVAAVSRRLPDTIYLHLVERRPLALWQHGGRLALIDYEGAVIPDERLERFGDLLLVVGEGAPARTADLLEMLWRQPELMEEVRAAVWVGGRRWNLNLRNGIDVRLPEENPAAAWARLAAYERTHGILAKDVGVLDLRLPDRLIVQKVPLKKGRDLGQET